MQSLLFIILCYLTIAFVWISTAFSNKRVVEKSGGWTLRIIALIIVFLTLYAPQYIKTLDVMLWSRTFTTVFVADIVTAMGVLIMIWARVTLGKNWSGNIVLKKDHELIMYGPYAYVRHPIYSGLLLVILGSAIYAGYFIWFLLWVFFFIGAYYKSMKEEEILVKHFSEAYQNYKFRVKALIPFLF